MPDDSFSGADNPCAASTLAWLMSDISETNTSAGWLTDLEHILWDVVLGFDPPHTWDWDPVNDAGWAEPPRWDVGNNEIAVLRQLSAMCGGWVEWSSHPEDHGRRFVPLSEWLKRHDSWRTAHPRQSASSG